MPAKKRQSSDKTEVMEPAAATSSGSRDDGKKRAESTVSDDPICEITLTMSDKHEVTLELDKEVGYEVLYYWIEGLGDKKIPSVFRM